MQAQGNDANYRQAFESGQKRPYEGETAKLSAGSLILPKAVPRLDELLLEYLAFPGGNHDDQIDALSQSLNWRTEAEKREHFSWDMGYDSGCGGGGGAVRGRLRSKRCSGVVGGDHEVLHGRAVGRGDRRADPNNRLWPQTPPAGNGSTQAVRGAGDRQTGR